MSSQLGTELKRSKYRLLGLVGQGQFGRVFCAAHRQTGRLVALKNLDRDRFPTHKFLRELRFLLSLQHPNIVTCQALEHTATGRYLVMDYCEGGTLRQLMSEESSLRLSESLKLIADILAGLDHAHKRGIVHCDIKPENILLNVQASGWVARISDFGIARLSQEMNDQTMSNTGSPAYMAPERFYGQYSLTSDLYSVGIMLFELLAGYRPFCGTPAELMSAHLNCPVKIPDSIPAIWQPIILKALQKLSARRFHSAGEMLEAMQTIAATEGSGSWLNSQTIHLPLIKPTLTPPDCTFQFQQEEPLRHPLSALTVQTECFIQTHPQRFQAKVSAPYIAWLQDQQITFQISQVNPDSIDRQSTNLQSISRQPTNPQSINRQSIDRQPTNPQPTVLLSHSSFPHLVQAEVQYIVPLKTAIRELLPRPQGCFVVTEQSILLIPIGTEAQPNLMPKTVLQLEGDDVVAIESQGKWLATLSLCSDVETSAIRFWHSPSLAAMALAPEPVRFSTRERFSHPPQLLALDARHLAIVAALSAKQAHPSRVAENPGTLVKVITRRGSRVGSLILPLHLKQVMLTPTPYRLLAVDQKNPQSILWLDLKPYRVMRIGTELAPDFLAATVWGYVLANTEGQIVLLDQNGHPVGRMQAPAGITAIAPFGHHHLAIATWSGQQGSLYSLDLREIGADLLF